VRLLLLRQQLLDLGLASTSAFEVHDAGRGRAAPSGLRWLN
jgi:hypothetical protein